MLYVGPQPEATILDLLEAAPDFLRFGAGKGVLGVNDTLPLDDDCIRFLRDCDKVTDPHTEAFSDLAWNDDLPALSEPADAFLCCVCGGLACHSFHTI
jgi:hypothetical protein